MGKFVIALAIACGISSATAAGPQLVVLYGSCIGGKGMQFAIDPARAKRLPTWKYSSKTDPPLSIQAAVAAGARRVSQTLGGRKPAQLMSVRLVRTYSDPVVWYYIIDFAEPMASSPDVQRASATILLDGTPVEGSETSC